MKKISFNNKFTGAILSTGIIVLSINPGWTEGKDGLNLLLCAFLCLFPLILLLRGTRIFIPRIDIPFGLVCFFTLLFPTMFHPETLRWSTMLFTCAYCIFIMLMARVVKVSEFKPFQLNRTVKWIIYAYAIVLLVQQFCELTGLPVPMKSDMYPYYLKFKLNSLSAEPSHTSILLSVLMFYNGMTRKISDPSSSLFTEWKSNALLWLAYGWTLFSTLNTTAYLFALLSLLPFIERKNTGWLMIAVAAIAILMVTVPLGYIHHFDRFSTSVKALATLDEETIIQKEPSMAFRIIPSVRGAKKINFSQKETYTGHGVDADRRDLPDPPAQIHQRGGSAGFFGMWYNFGAFCTFAYWAGIFLVVLNPKKWQTYIMLIVALFLSADYNQQMIWQLLLLALVFNYFEESRKTNKVPTP